MNGVCGVSTEGRRRHRLVDCAVKRTGVEESKRVEKGDVLFCVGSGGAKQDNLIVRRVILGGMSARFYLGACGPPFQQNCAKHSSRPITSAPVFRADLGNHS